MALDFFIDAAFMAFIADFIGKAISTAGVERWGGHGDLHKAGLEPQHQRPENRRYTPLPPRPRKTWKKSFPPPPPPASSLVQTNAGLRDFHNTRLRAD